MTVNALMSVIAYFRITNARAKEILSEVAHAVDNWRMTGQSIGMSDEELQDLKIANRELATVRTAKCGSSWTADAK